MTAPTQLVSLRLSEDDISRLEARVGLDGTRSRSDVIRLAIQRLLSDAPTDPDMDRITIDIGLSVKQDLRAMRKFTGMAPEAVAQMALQQHIADFVAATKARRTEMGDLYEELSAQEHSSKEHQ
jgi:Arc/MetJ-type ribon-helix-helix transcriptional regulator